MSQCGAILERLLLGESITPADAYQRHGCLALHSRIAELRQRGYQIDCRIVVKDGKRWGEYRLVVSEAQQPELFAEPVYTCPRSGVDSDSQKDESLR